MELIIETHDATLDFAVAGKGDHVDGIVACAYAGQLSVGGKVIDIWGYGGARSPETFNAYGVCHALDEAFAELTSDTFSLHIWALHKGFLRFIEKHVPEWLLNGGKNSSGEVPDAYVEWRRLWQMVNIGRLVIDKATPSHLKGVKGEATRLAGVALQHSCYRTAVIARSGTGFRNVK